MAWNAATAEAMAERSDFTVEITHEANWSAGDLGWQMVSVAVVQLS